MTQLLNAIASLVIICWVLSGTVIMVAKMFGREPNATARTIFHELRSIYLPAVVICIAIDVYNGRMLHPSDLIANTLGLYNWWGLKDIDKDDRWKRRKEKLVERVTRTGSRLTTVAAES